MPQLHPHVNFNGNAQEAFDFYRSIFGGEFSKIIRFKELPQNPHFSIPEEEGNCLMNITLSIGNHSFLSGNDVPSFMGTVNTMENRSKINVMAENKEEADRIFAGLSVGAEVEVPMNQNPGGGYFGMLRDKYGIEWMVNAD